MTENFKTYLYEHRLRDSTVNGHLQNVGYFLKWIEASGLHEPENISYNDLLNYVQYEQKRNMDVATINLRMGSISKYFDFLAGATVVLNNFSRVRTGQNRLPIWEIARRYSTHVVYRHLWLTVRQVPNYHASSSSGFSIAAQKPRHSLSLCAVTKME